MQIDANWVDISSKQAYITRIALEVEENLFPNDEYYGQ